MSEPYEWDEVDPDYAPWTWTAASPELTAETTELACRTSGDERRP